MVMKYVLFDWDDIDKLSEEEADEVNDVSDLSDERYIELTLKMGGIVTDDIDDFESMFNSEEISTTRHQLRIIK